MSRQNEAHTSDRPKYFLPSVTIYRTIFNHATLFRYNLCKGVRKMLYLQNFMGSLNVLFVPIAILLLILIDYNKDFSGDLFQRKIFFVSVFSTFLAIISDMTYDIFAGVPGQAAHVILYISSFIYYAFQVSAYHATNLFVDYTINQDRTRTKNFSIIIGVVLLLHMIVLTINCWSDFYFFINDNNYFVSGRLYIIRLIFSYSAAVVTLVNVIISRKNIRKGQISLIMFFILLTSFGSSLDLLLPGAKLVWACFCSAILFSYFFIIRSESHIDVLTGLNNRRSCEEYIRTITTMSKRHTYSFFMIDLDKFKSINDNYGHLQGDYALKDAAQLIRNCLRKQDFVARYGGDEFFVITQGNTLDILVTRINSEFVKFNERKLREFNLELSIGCDVYHPDSELTPQEFVAHVDRLMYEKKGERRKTSL